MMDKSFRMRRSTLITPTIHVQAEILDDFAPNDPDVGQHHADVAYDEDELNNTKCIRNIEDLPDLVVIKINIIG